MSRHHSRMVTAEFREWHRAVSALARYYEVSFAVLVRAAEAEDMSEFRPPLSGAAYPAYREGYITKAQARMLGAKV